MGFCPLQHAANAHAEGAGSLTRCTVGVGRFRKVKTEHSKLALLHRHDENEQVPQDESVEHFIIVLVLFLLLFFYEGKNLIQMSF